MELQRDFDISAEVTVLVISLFVAGYCVGWVLFLYSFWTRRFGQTSRLGPTLRELWASSDIPRMFYWIYGKPIACNLVYRLILCQLFHIAMALAKNAPSFLVFRFIGGLFAAGSLSNSPYMQFLIIRLIYLICSLVQSLEISLIPEWEAKHWLSGL